MLDNFINRDSLIPAHHTCAGEREESEARPALQSEIVIEKQKNIYAERWPVKMRRRTMTVCVRVCASLHVSVNVPTRITSKVIRTAVCE